MFFANLNLDSSVSLFRKHLSGNNLLILHLSVIILISACSDDNDVIPSCPEQGVDARLVGDWMMCDRNGEYFTFGMRIFPDGNRERIGVDWSTGKTALVPDACPLGKIFCVGPGRFTDYDVPHADDTYTFTINGNRLIIVEGWECGDSLFYRRAALGRSLFSPVTCSFTTTTDSVSYTAPVIWTRLPVEAIYEDEGGDGEFRIMVSGKRNFYIHIYEFTGSGSYRLATPRKNGSYVGESSGCYCPQSNGVSSDEAVSVLTITDFDLEGKRCSGTFHFELGYPQMPGTRIMDGSFDTPVSLSP